MEHFKKTYAVCASSMLSITRYLTLFMLSMLIAFTVPAQETSSTATDTTCSQKDVGDVIRAALHKPPKAVVDKGGSVLLIPIIGSNPATGFMYGIGGQYAFKLGEADTRYSMLSGSAQLTTKNQVIFL